MFDIEHIEAWLYVTIITKDKRLENTKLPLNVTALALRTW